MYRSIDQNDVFWKVSVELFFRVDVAWRCLLIIQDVLERTWFLHLFESGWRNLVKTGSAIRIQPSVWLERCWALDAFSRLKPRQEQSELNATLEISLFCHSKIDVTSLIFVGRFRVFPNSMISWLLHKIQAIFGTVLEAAFSPLFFSSRSRPNNLYLRSHNPNWCFP